MLGIVSSIYAGTPIANAGPDQIVGPGDFVQLDGTASTGDGLSFSWVQIEGEIVVLTGATTATPSFVFPNVNETLIFQLTVTDIDGVTDSDTVAIIPEEIGAPPSLKTIAIPEPPDLNDYVVNRDAAIQLGKALFWDMQVGSDGVQACATCHYSAGTDNRATNRLHPGADSIFQAGTPDGTLQLDDFPFHKLADPADRNSTVLFDTDDVAGGQGVEMQNFVSIVPGNAEDAGQPVPDPIFNVNGQNVHQVTGRDTPSVINAVFNVRNFWDGRANFVFNGVNPFGQRDPNAVVLEVQPDDSVVPVTVRLQFASLASQAVGPPNSAVEMAWNGRTFPDIGKKMLTLTPLGKQIVDPTDSVLGPLANPSGPGLTISYEDLIKTAFNPEYWDSDVMVVFDANGNPTVLPNPGRPLSLDEYTLMEANFSLFFGLAVQLYESTLVSDNAPYDQFQEGNDAALTDQQKLGLQLFIGKANCIACHDGPEFSKATVSHILVHSEPGPAEELIERMLMGDGGLAVYDNGFYNIGVRPTSEDLGVGGTDPFGNPLSFTRLIQQGIIVGPPFLINPPVNPTERVAVDGSFKTPTLRNIELTAPYMHNGGMATLEQVMEFYNRGGDFHDENMADLDPNIGNLGLTQEEIDALVAFMISLTDERVRYQQAPFDHPQLFIPDGNGELLEIPAVGATGGPPLQPFVDIHPSMAVSMTADKTNVVLGEQVVYTVTIENTGDSNLDKFVLNTNLGNCIWDGPYNDQWGSNILEVGETWTYTCTTTPAVSQTHTVVVNAEDKLNNPISSDPLEWSVDVLVPVYFSIGKKVSVTGNTYSNEDVLYYDGSTISIFFDGSDLGLNRSNIDALYVMDASTLLLSFDRPLTIPGLGTVDDSDIVRFDATSLGTNTAGTFSMFFRGATAGLTTNGEDIDGMSLLPDGTLLVSVYGGARVPGNIRANDEDLLAFTPNISGNYNSGGTWSLYFDGSDVSLTTSYEDVNGVTVISTGDIYLTTIGEYSLPVFSGENEDIFVCQWPVTGSATSCTYA
ncbi:MAG: hypothetical protein D6706_11995, partial [Chloroflexi bacterium]